MKFRDAVAPFGQGIKEALNKGMLEMKKAKETQKTTAKKPADIEEQINYLIEKTKD